MSDDTDEKVRQRDVSVQAALKVQDLLLMKGLYAAIEVDDEVSRAAEQKIRNASIGTFDCYCIGCKKETSFIIAAMPVSNTGGGLRFGNAIAIPPVVFAVRSVCQRDLTTYLYVFQKIGSRLIKIGQQPSMADIAFGELKGIDKALEPLDRKELGKAIGLFAHDAASGAFLYLRRVFERMIGRAHARQVERNGPIEGFEGMRVDEKIAALKDELPERVVRDSAVFSVLSSGMHELTDEECMALFPVLKAVIFQMLEQEEHKRKKKITERETDAAFQALMSTSMVSLPSGEVAPSVEASVLITKPTSASL